MLNVIRFPPVLGILGGIASGKSFVAACFEELGAGRLDADRAGHEVLCEPEVQVAAKARWGEAVFAADGRIRRSSLAAIVFGPDPQAPAELAFLEHLTHPRIGEKLREQADSHAAAGKKLLILDAPVMLEAGWDTMCRWVAFVEVPEDVRLRRAAERGWSRDAYRAREAAQASLDVKRRRADFVLDNSGTPDEMRAQVARLWSSLVG